MAAWKSPPFPYDVKVGMAYDVSLENNIYARRCLPAVAVDLRATEWGISHGHQKGLAASHLPSKNRRMAEMFTWIVFRAHPSGFVPDEDFHPDYFGTFVCPASRSRPEELLKELLGNQKLSLIEINSTRLKSNADDWGMNERLKRPLDEHGYAMTLVKVQAPAEQVE